MSTWAKPNRRSDLPKRTRKPLQMEQSPVLCLTGLIHPLVTTNLPILSAKNFSSALCQYPLPEESFKHRMLKSAATAYFVSVKTNLGEKNKNLYFVLQMAIFLWETAFLDPQEVKASLR